MLGPCLAPTARAPVPLFLAVMLLPTFQTSWAKFIVAKVLPRLLYLVLLPVTVSVALVAELLSRGRFRRKAYVFVRIPS